MKPRFNVLISVDDPETFAAIVVEFNDHIADVQVVDTEEKKPTPPKKRRRKTTMQRGGKLKLGPNATAPAQEGGKSYLIATQAATKFLTLHPQGVLRSEVNKVVAEQLAQKGFSRNSATAIISRQVKHGVLEYVA